jgi:hypothetical protein
MFHLGARQLGFGYGTRDEFKLGNVEARVAV